MIKPNQIWEKNYELGQGSRREKYDKDQTRYYTSNDRPSNMHCYLFMSLLAVSSI